MAKSHIFVCYAHHDVELVTPEIDWLRSQGFPVFVDERVHPGAEWAEELAEAIDKCELVLFFASAVSAESPHCRNEIAYAVDTDKPVLTVFCEPLELSGGLKLTISRSQAILRWQLNQDEYRQQLKRALNLAETSLLTELRSLPRTGIWRIPFNRNSRFSGREDLLDELQAVFDTADRPAPVALTGQAGVGKTQLALEYCYRYGKARNVVAWIRSEDNASTVTDLIGLARELNLLEGDEIDAPMVLDALREWLAEHRNWLVVLDNLESPEMIRRFFPSELTGHLLITSRRPTWGRQALVVPIDPFNEDEAVSFILERARPDDTISAKRLAELLGYLPLALEEAVAYIESTGRSVAGYIDLFEKHHDALMSTTAPPYDYNQTLRTTLEVSLSKVREEQPDAAVLLNHLAYLAPDEVELSMLEHLPIWPEDAQHRPRELVVDECVSALLRLSLIKSHSDSVSTHRLTQLVVRDLLPSELRERMAIEALNCVAELFPRVSDMGETGDLCRKLLPHAIAVLSHTRNLPSAALAAGKLLNRTGTYMSARNLAREASEHLAEAYQIFRKQQPQDLRQLARSCELYARTLYANGSLDHAQQIFEEALHAFEPEGSSALLHRMQIHLDLAWVIWTKGEFQEAKDHARQSLALLESVFGQSSPFRATSLSMISRLELELGETAAAGTLVEEVVSSIPKIPELDRERQPLLCAVFLQMSQVLRSIGWPNRARSWAQESLALGKSVFSDHHTLMGATHCVLGQALFDLEEFEQARVEFLAATECAERYRFPINQHVIVGISYLAITLTELGELNAASELLTKHPADPERTTAGETAFARCYAGLARGWHAYHIGEFESAERLCEAADQTLADKYGEHSPYRLYPLALVASCLRKGGHNETALRTHELALEIAAANDLADHPDRARHLEGLSELAALEGRFSDSLALSQQALNVYRNCLGPASRPVARLEAELEARV